MNIHPSKQSKPKYLPGDIFKTASGGIGVISKVNINECQEDPWHVSYAAEQIHGQPPIEYLSWWQEGDLKEVIKGPLHAIIESGKNPFET